MLNRQLTMGNSKDNMMASDARRTFAAENNENIEHYARKQERRNKVLYSG